MKKLKESFLEYYDLIVNISMWLNVILPVLFSLTDTKTITLIAKKLNTIMN